MENTDIKNNITIRDTYNNFKNNGLIIALGGTLLGFIGFLIYYFTDAIHLIFWKIDFAWTDVASNWHLYKFLLDFFAIIPIFIVYILTNTDYSFKKLFIKNYEDNNLSKENKWLIFGILILKGALLYISFLLISNFEFLDIVGFIIYCLLMNFIINSYKNKIIPETKLAYHELIINGNQKISKFVKEITIIIVIFLGYIVLSYIMECLSYKVFGRDFTIINDNQVVIYRMPDTFIVQSFTSEDDTIYIDTSSYKYISIHDVNITKKHFIHIEKK